MYRRGLKIDATTFDKKSMRIAAAICLALPVTLLSFIAWVGFMMSEDWSAHSPQQTSADNMVDTVAIATVAVGLVQAIWDATGRWILPKADRS